MLILYDSATLSHRTVELLGSKLIPALESPERITSIISTIVSSSPSHDHKLIEISCSSSDASEALELAATTHDAGYLSHFENVFSDWRDAGLVEEDEVVLPECFRLHSSAQRSLPIPKDIYARAGYYAFDMSCGISRGSWRSIIASANLAVKAVQMLARNGGGEEKVIVALTRPPGHHCTGVQAGGYCYLNNVVVAASAIKLSVARSRSEEVPRISILDLDFHHGNGTQELTYNDPGVLYISIHGEDEFPYYTGFADETGGPQAPETNVNMPLPTGSSFEVYKEALRTVLKKLVGFKPQWLMISLGFDTFKLDPLGKFEIDTEDYVLIGQMVKKAAGNIPIVVLLEGGYVLDRLGPNLLSFLEGMTDSSSSGKGDQEMYQSSAHNFAFAPSHD